MGEVWVEEPNYSIFEVKGMIQQSFDKLFEFFQKDILCDVVIKVGNKAIKCHRNVLASCSPYFQAMFTSPLAESQQHDVTIKDIDENIMEMLIRFAYTAKIELDTSNAQLLLHAASLLQLDSLAQACCEFMISQLHPCNCLGIRQLADQLAQLNLIEKCDAYARLHFEHLSPDEFINISPLHLEELISSIDLYVNNEIKVYEAVLQWIKHDICRKDHLPKLLSKVRLPMLPLSYLRTNVETEPLIHSSIECRDLLDEARHYQMWKGHILPTLQMPLNERIRPRKSYAGS